MIWENISIKPTPIASWSNVQATTTHLLSYEPSLTNQLANLPLRFIPRGAGRSFGDAAYLTDGFTLASQGLDRILEYNQKQGTLVCESGVSMSQIHAYLDGTNWTFAIYGGTQWVTVGGAVASDIHGKNDVHQGSFGNQIQSITLITPDGHERECSQQIEPDLFRATIGGMGLTGLIKKVTLKLRQGLSRTVQFRSRPVFSLDDAVHYFNQNDNDFQFCTWISCTPRSTKGLFFSASYAEGDCPRPRQASEIRLPSTKLFNKFSIQVGSQIVYQLQRNLEKKVHVMDFNFIGVHERFKHWNRLYKPVGFIEYHFVVSASYLHDTLIQLIKMCDSRGLTIHFVVMKRFGNLERAGLLSFPKEGYTMNFQIEARPESRKFLLDFTDFLLELKSRVYLAKDSCILPRQVEAMYGNLDQWRQIVIKYDPTNQVQSDLSLRLGLKPW